MKSVIIALTILAFAIGVSAYFNQTQKKKELITLSPTPSASQVQTKTDDSGTVAVDAKPMKLERGNQQFELTITTHTGDLSEDLTKVSKLLIDGVESLPVDWVGSPPGGHHRKGVLFFESYAEEFKSVKLIIESIGGERKDFVWSK